jgi:cytochrome c-type protein NapC
MELATDEWKRMEVAGSRECKNCHRPGRQWMPPSRNPRHEKKHAFAEANGKTCVDCHKGIAHLLPAKYA